jgi:DHA2 family methylenomycin A resistance protein-like MFS transporter
MILGAAVTLAGYAMLSQFGAATSYVAMLVPFIVLPAGMGFAIPAMTAAVLSSVDRKRSGTASAVLNASRQTGGAMGVAIFGALVGNTAVQIVKGIKLASLASVVLLLIATFLAWKFIRRRRDSVAMEGRVGFHIE